MVRDRGNSNTDVMHWREEREGGGWRGRVGREEGGWRGEEREGGEGGETEGGRKGKRKDTG